MQKKYRFRKMFFKCYDNRVIEDCYEMTNAFRRREYILRLLKANDMGEGHRYLWEKDKYKPKVTVEGFYLVHESLFDEILKPFANEETIKNDPLT